MFIGFRFLISLKTSEKPQWEQLRQKQNINQARTLKINITI